MKNARAKGEGRRTYDHLAASLQKHLIDCEASNKSQNEAIADVATAVREMREDMTPVLEIYRAGAVANSVIKFLLGLGAFVVMLYGGVRWLRGG